MTNDRLSGFNPLRGLTLEGLVNFFEQGERGYYADLMWLYRQILRRNGVARAVRRKLTSAIGRLDWNIKIPDDLDGARKALAERQQEELRQAYDAVENLNDALVHLAMADILGFSHCNKVYAGGAGLDAWLVRELRVVEQWHLCRDGLFRPWQYNRAAAATNRGEPIDERHWILREVADPAAEIFALAHVKMSTTDADWDQFCDTYAVNPIFIEGPPNARREDEDQFQATAEQIVSDGRGYLPHGSKVHVVSPGTGGGSSVFTERLRYYREEIVLAGTGGILTTLSGEGAFGQGGASDNHEDAWLDIAAGIGSAVSTALQRGFDLPFLARRFPGEERLAYFALDKPEHDRDASDVLGDAKLAREAGFRMDAEEASEKTGYKLERDEAAAVATKDFTTEDTEGTEEEGTTPEVAPVAARELPEVDPAKESLKASQAGEAKPSLVEAALAADLEIEQRWLAPVGDVLGEIERMLLDSAIPLEEVIAKAEQAAKAMPDLLGAFDVDALAAALENASGPAAVEGLADGLRAKTKTAKA